MKFEYSRQILEKFSYLISWKSVHWEPSCSMRTYRQEANSRFSQFCQRAKKLKYII